MNQEPLRHGPNRLKSYVNTHWTIFCKFKDRGFVGPDTLEFRPLDQAYLLCGEIGCLGGLVIGVEKFIKVVEPIPKNPLLETQWYTYNLSIRNQCNIFRYDNQDKDFSFRQGHKDTHHKHVFNWKTGDEISESPIWIGTEKWPLLSEVIEEAEAWYWEHRLLLTNPDSYPEVFELTFR